MSIVKDLDGCCQSHTQKKKSLVDPSNRRCQFLKVLYVLDFDQLQWDVRESHWRTRQTIDFVTVHDGKCCQVNFEVLESQQKLDSLIAVENLTSLFAKMEWIRQPLTLDPEQSRTLLLMIIRRPFFFWRRKLEAKSGFFRLKSVKNRRSENRSRKERFLLLVKIKPALLKLQKFSLKNPQNS